LTSIPETAISDGSTFPRLGADETISGGWTFTKATAPITVQAGAGTSAFQAVTATTVNASSTITAGGTGFSGGGANVTGIAEANITDGSVLARVGGNETISGTWTFSNAITMPSGVAWSGKEMEVFHFGGDWREYVDDTSYVAGSSMASTVPGSGVWFVDGTQFPGTYRLEGICKSSTGTPTASVVIRNLVSDIALTGGEATVSTTMAGERFATTAFTFSAGLSYYFVKQKTSANAISCWSIRVVRIS
jgi:hypothetical protein